MSLYLVISFLLTSLTSELLTNFTEGLGQEQASLPLAQAAAQIASVERLGSPVSTEYTTDEKSGSCPFIYKKHIQTKRKKYLFFTENNKRE